MESQSDKLFRDKLERHPKTPPPYAWSRIEMRLNRKRLLRNQFKAVAALLLLLSTSFLIWKSGNPTLQPRLASQENNMNSPSTSVPAPQIPAQQQKPSTPDDKIPGPDRHTAIAVQSISIKKTNDEPQDTTMISEITSTPIHRSTPDEIVNVVTVIPEQSPNKLPHDPPAYTTPYQSKNIVYAVQEVNTRFLKKDLLIASVEDPKPESGFRKVLDFAGDLKNNEFSIGDLRQIKNDFLSIPLQNQIKTK